VLPEGCEGTAPVDAMLTVGCFRAAVFDDVTDMLYKTLSTNPHHRHVTISSTALALSPPFTVSTVLKETLALSPPFTVSTVLKETAMIYCFTHKLKLMNNLMKYHHALHNTGKMSPPCH